jgi:N-acetylglucosaminyl-diphospho-decaprenol L-rhamnosyltransferase
MHSVDVIIVSYNSRGTLRAAVTPLLEIPGVNVIVVDNASSDGSLDELAGLDVQTIAAGRNGGFGSGCNLGTAAGRARYVLFLNPDARIEAADLDTLAGVLDAEPATAIVGPRLLDGTGTLIPNLRRAQRTRSIWAQALFLHRLAPSAPWANEIDRSVPAHDHIAYPEWISGACMLARRDMLEHIGGFDEDFFLYGEDMDLCTRIRSHGGRVRFEPGATVRHQEGQSAPRTSLYSVLAQSRLIYARKHSSRAGAALQRAGLCTEALTRVLGNVGRPAKRRGHTAALRVLLA